jgi:hypothetical protein
MTSAGAPREASDKTRLMLRALVVDAATAELFAALREKDVRAVLLKGPAFARWLYGDDALRPYGDADVLVDVETLESVETTLAELGYTLAPLGAISGDFPRHARGFVRPGGGAIDLHTTLPGADADATIVWHVASERTESIEIGGVEIEILSEPARALMVALHAAKDGTRVHKVMHDLGHALDRVAFDTWRDASVLANRMGAGPAFAAGLRLDDRGRLVADELGLAHEQSTLLALRTGRDGPPPLAVGIDWLLTEHSWKRRVAVTARKLFPPPAYLRASSKVARRGGVGLAIAYVTRPFVMAAQAIPAGYAVWRARRRR